MNNSREVQLERFPDSSLLMEGSEDESGIGIRIGKVIAEFMGTGTLVFIGCLGNVPDVYGVPIFAPIVFGLAVTAAIQMYGHISGGHFNPCVTVAAVIMGKLEIIMAPFYMLAQFGGGIVGYGLLYLLTREQMHDGCCVTLLHPRIALYQGVLIELAITGFLVSICCAVWDNRTKNDTDSVSLRFGFILAAVFIGAGKWTGASVNPARSLGPAVFQNIWDDHWVYWVGPFAGAILMATSYRFTYIQGLAKIGSKS